MSSSTESIFEFGLSENLQLVEDLWDDIAATPEAVCVHDSQREELERRKMNLLTIHARRFSWEEIQPANSQSIWPLIQQFTLCFDRSAVNLRGSTTK
jgi:putative addiction module component (TIGR02574 family)